MPETESGFGSKHFKIFYSSPDEEFRIKDLGEGTGTFVKIENQAAAKDGTMFSFGNFNTLINMIPAAEIHKDDTIKIRIVEGAEAKAQ